MKRHRVMIVYSDPELARAIGPELGDASFEFSLAASLDQVRALFHKHDFQCVIADIEVIPISQLRAMRSEYGIQFVCVHRNADNGMWVESLRAGAIDCCYSDDLSSINRALHASKHAKSQALAATAA